MDLAYSAYVPLTGDFSGLAPGLFMEDNIVSAEDLLDDYGIKSVAFNTEEDDTVCHIIGHKQIYADINYNTSCDTNGGNNNGYLGILEGTGRCKPIGVFSGSNHPVYGPMILWGLLGLIVQEIQKFLGIH